MPRGDPSEPGSSIHQLLKDRRGLKNGYCEEIVTTLDVFALRRVALGFRGRLDVDAEQFVGFIIGGTFIVLGDENDGLALRGRSGRAGEAEGRPSERPEDVRPVREEQG